MKKTYSTYEAKARFSEIVRRVRERGESVTVTWHGEPVAEIRPAPSEGAETIEARLRVLENHGVYQPSTREPTGLRRISRKRGALERFLSERED
jgi:prevent-host-death family protein